MAQVQTDPFVQRRNANAQANAEYRASKKASKQQMQAAVDDAKAHYDEEVANAKINRKADKNAATNELRASEPRAPKGRRPAALTLPWAFATFEECERKRPDEKLTSRR